MVIGFCALRHSPKVPLGAIFRWFEIRFSHRDDTYKIPSGGSAGAETQQGETVMSREMVTLEGNEATAYVAFRASEVIAIYPITPSSTMGEYADQWMSEGKRNIWGTVPLVQEMQSEGGAAGAGHGAPQAGCAVPPFTAP